MLHNYSTGNDRNQSIKDALGKIHRATYVKLRDDTKMYDSKLTDGLKNLQALNEIVKVGRYYALPEFEEELLAAPEIGRNSKITRLHELDVAAGLMALIPNPVANEELVKRNSNFATEGLMHLKTRYPKTYGECKSIKVNQDKLWEIILTLSDKLLLEEIFKLTEAGVRTDIGWQMLAYASPENVTLDINKLGVKVTEEPNKLLLKGKAAILEVSKSDNFHSLKSKFENSSKLKSTNQSKFNEDVRLLIKKLIHGTEKLRGLCMVCGANFSSGERKEFEELSSFLVRVNR